jgi:tRNA (guanine-N7-)-methyltransferase
VTAHADLGREPRPETLRPGVRTFKPRRSRITPTAQRALQERADLLIPFADEPIDRAAIWGPDVPLVIEIGFGDGRATAGMALNQPEIGLLAIDVHTPGLGEALARLGEAGIDHVRLMEADAIVVLERMIPPDSLIGVRAFFPDPWPKARHHKRRLVQPAIVDLVRTRLVIGGTWHLATDWAEYATAMEECFALAPGWTGGVIARPQGRPVTRYEARALREGRTITDLEFRRTA